jgi:hypothetical protein
MYFSQWNSAKKSREPRSKGKRTAVSRIKPLQVIKKVEGHESSYWGGAQSTNDDRQTTFERERKQSHWQTAGRFFGAERSEVAEETLKRIVMEGMYLSLSLSLNPKFSLSWLPLWLNFTSLTTRLTEIFFPLLFPLLMSYDSLEFHRISPQYFRIRFEHCATFENSLPDCCVYTAMPF